MNPVTLHVILVAGGLLIGAGVGLLVGVALGRAALRVELVEQEVDRHMPGRALLCSVCPGRPYLARTPRRVRLETYGRTRGVLPSELPADAGEHVLGGHRNGSGWGKAPARFRPLGGKLKPKPGGTDAR